MRLEQALAEIKAGKLSDVFFDSDADKHKDERVEAHIQCGTEAYVREWVVAPWSYRLMLAAGKNALKPDELVELGCRIAERTKAKAGVLVYKRSFTSIGNFVFSSNYSDVARKEDGKTDVLGTDEWAVTIRGPEWGTFLNPKHVVSVGGVNGLTSHESVFFCKPLEYGGAFVQLSEEPEGVGTAAGKKRLAELREFLSPILPQ